MNELQEAVARSSDAADLHGAVPALMLETQAAIGELATRVSESTGRGRRPFRPTPEWATALGNAAYNLYLLADQSGVDLDEVVTLTARHIEARGAQGAGEASWPFDTH